MSLAAEHDFIIVLRSDSQGVRKNFETIPVENSFTATISPLFLDDAESYSVMVHSLEYASAVGEGIRVNLDMQEYIRIGNDMSPTVYRVPAALATGAFVVSEQDTSTPLYHQLLDNDRITNIRVDLVNDVTGIISTTPRALPTVLTLIIRRNDHL